MAERVLMIALSPTMEDGTISKWIKHEGDEVANGDVICEVETDKATMEYESIQEGTLRKLLVPEGETAEIEEPIAVIGKPDEDIVPLLEEIQKEKEAKSGAPETEGKKETEREVAPTTTAPESGAAAGTSDRVSSKSGGEGHVGEVAEGGAQARGPGGKVKGSPLARSLAEKHGIDIASVRGSGPEGRVVKRDIEKHLRVGAGTGVGGVSTRTAGAEAGSAARTAGTAEGAATTRAAAGAAGMAAGAPTTRAATTGTSAGGPASAERGAAQFVPAPPEDVRTPISRKRRIIADRLSGSKYTAPHYYLRISAEAGRLLESRTSYNARTEKRLSLNAFLVKLTAEALKKHPQVNSSWQENDIITFGSIDIGLAVAQKDGLITPVVRNCGNKGIIIIDDELKALIHKARNNDLTPDDYTGATFTISNLGSAGIEEFTAIINPPGSAILAVGTVVKKPVVTDTGDIAAGNIMTLTLSCDHRVIDGAVGADFLAEIKNMIEDPVQALF